MESIIGYFDEQLFIVGKITDNNLWTLKPVYLLQIIFTYNSFNVPLRIDNFCLQTEVNAFSSICFPYFYSW